MLIQVAGAVVVYGLAMLLGKLTDVDVTQQIRLADAGRSWNKPTANTALLPRPTSVDAPSQLWPLSLRQHALFSFAPRVPLALSWTKL